MNSSHKKKPSELALFGGGATRSKPVETGIFISDAAKQRILALLEKGRLSDYHNGPWARRFEEEFARAHGSSLHGIAVNSGTSALHLAVTAAGVGLGDEVIMPALCFVAAATAVVQNGGVPMICDAEKDSLTMDVAQAEALIGPRTKAILVVHFWGYPANMAAFRALCDCHGLTLIEDCAQALSAPTCGGKVGTFSDYATYAFSVRKHIACGEGGMVLCRGEETYDHLRRLSNYGKGPAWDDYSSLGYSYRMAEFPAIVALDGLERLNAEIRARRQAGAHYAELFRDSGLCVVPEPTWGHSVFFKCPVLLPPEMIYARQKIVDAISAENVSCRVPHRPLFAIPWLAEYLNGKAAYRGTDDCPVAATAHARLIEIETGPHLPMEEVQVTGAAVMKVWRHFSA